MDSQPVISFLHNNLSFIFLATNPQGSTFLVIVLIGLLLLSFTISGAEVALFSLSSKDVNMLKTKQHTAARRIVSLLEEPKEVYASLLIAGTFINICIIVLSNFLIDRFIYFGKDNFVVEILSKVLVIAFVLVFFGEVLPKVWATQNNLRFAYGASFIVEAVHLFLRRISKWIVSLADGIGKRLGADKSEAVSIRELDQAIDIKTDEEASPEEKSIMKGIVKFGSISVRQIMRSRLDVKGVDFNSSFGNLIHRAEELHYSRLPVYKNNLDEVAGIINTKDLIPFLTEADDFDWHILMRQPYFVHESKLIEDLLKDFQSKHLHFAIVVDEFGGTSGIVTMEDILEEVIGEIKDEFDEEENRNRKLDDNNYIFEGKTMLHDMCKTMQLPIDTFDKVRGDSESLAGLILELAGEFPAVNATIPCGDFEFTILQADNNRIRQVKVTIKPNIN
ncbi:MAG: gliding motility-associated protein GldE [Chitinophagales bacterium]